MEFYLPLWNATWSPGVVKGLGCVTRPKTCGGRLRMGKHVGGGRGSNMEQRRGGGIEPGGMGRGLAHGRGGLGLDVRGKVGCGSGHGYVYGCRGQG